MFRHFICILPSAYSITLICTFHFAHSQSQFFYITKPYIKKISQHSSIYLHLSHSLVRGLFILVHNLSQKILESRVEKCHLGPLVIFLNLLKHALVPQEIRNAAPTVFSPVVTRRGDCLRAALIEKWRRRRLCIWEGCSIHALPPFRRGELLIVLLCQYIFLIQIDPFWYY